MVSFGGDGGQYVQAGGSDGGADGRQHPDQRADREHTASDHAGTANELKPWLASADTSAQPRNTPSPKPPTVPNSATVSASPRR